MKEEEDPPARRPYRMGARADAAAATADRVLEVAFERFTERPYEDVALEEIARLAGVAKRTVLRRFGSKEELFVAAMMERARAEMRRRDETPVGDVAGAVATVVASYERFGANRLRLLAQEDRIPVVAENVEGGRRYHRSWVERTFAPFLGAASGGTGRGGSRGAAGRRGAGGAGAGGVGRGKDKDKKRKAPTVELFDEDRDWIDDEGASSGVID
jgi:AcrR family transcriptional regulator